MTKERERENKVGNHKVYQNVMTKKILEEK